MNKKHRKIKKSSDKTRERRQASSAASLEDEGACIRRNIKPQTTPTYNLQSFEYTGFRR